MWGIDDPTVPHAPVTNLPDARLNVLHVTIWYIIRLILWTKHTLAFIKKEKTRKNYLSIQSTHCYSHQCQTVWIQVKTHILSVLTGSKLFALVICRRQKSPRAHGLISVYTVADQSKLFVKPVCIQIRIDKMSVLIGVQTVCLGCQAASQEYVHKVDKQIPV